ncbi:MAG: hypothetical protein KME17_28865 [Cyanosarcina radialis HA8281-LM2]|nr:hypothetical protein [Cyanosarcina radialis HA8281-LM2]
MVLTALGDRRYYEFSVLSVKLPHLARLASSWSSHLYTGAAIAGFIIHNS